MAGLSQRNNDRKAYRIPSKSRWRIILRLLSELQDRRIQYAQWRTYSQNYQQTVSCILCLCTGVYHVTLDTSPAPTEKSRNSACNFANSLAAHCRGGALLHPKSLVVSQGLSGRAMLAPTMKLQTSDIIFMKILPFACRGLHCRPANGAACFWYSRSPPIRAKTFSYSQKRPASVSLAGLISWCTISGSVQKTVQCTVFSDRSPRAERKLHSSAARSRPVGDGAPCASLSITHNAKKDPQTKPFAGLSSWCTISGSV